MTGHGNLDLVQKRRIMRLDLAHAAIACRWCCNILYHVNLRKLHTFHKVWLKATDVTIGHRAEQQDKKLLHEGLLAFKKRFLI